MKLRLFALLLAAAATTGRAQSVGIGTTTPDPAAALNISSGTCPPGPPLGHR